MLEFKLETMPFISSYPTTSQWTSVGYMDIKAMFDRGDAKGDFSEFFWGLYDLLPIINNGKYTHEELWTELFTIKSKATPDGDRMVEAVYGGSVKKFEDELVLVFGSRLFPITQDKKRLSCGGLSGDLTAIPLKDEGGKDFYKLAWQPELTVPDGEGGERYYMFSFPVLMALNEEKKPKHRVTPELLNREIAKSSLLDFVAEHNSGNSDFTRYGTVNNRVEGEQIYKAYELFDGVGVMSFTVIGASVGTGINKKDGSEFESVMFQLQDGRKANANSNALKAFWALSEAEREDAIPFVWQVDKYEEKKSKSSIKMIPKATKVLSATKFPQASWLTIAPATDTVAPTKSAKVNADGSADDEDF